MRPPSRHMPQLQRPQPGLGIRLMAALLLLGLCYGGYAAFMAVLG